MNVDEFLDLKHREEQKREANWDPAERWRALQAMIAWADAQAPVPRNTPARCLELQRAKLAALAAAEEGK
jgi:hypothetical protein